MQANIVVGNRPRRFAMTPDQKELWVTNEISGEVTIIDPATNKVTKTIKFQPKGFREEDVTPVGITMSSDGKTAIVGLGGANHIAFVDVASHEIQDYVLVGKPGATTERAFDDLRAELRAMLDSQLDDYRNGWEMQSDGNYVKRQARDAADEAGSQRQLIDRARQRAKQATRYQRGKARRHVAGRNLR
jgi:YVTN family beta-propeller protein